MGRSHCQICHEQAPPFFNLYRVNLDAAIVDDPMHWRYFSARDYAGLVVIRSAARLECIPTQRVGTRNVYKDERAAWERGILYL